MGYLIFFVIIFFIYYVVIKIADARRVVRSSSDTTTASHTTSKRQSNTSPDIYRPSSNPRSGKVVFTDQSVSHNIKILDLSGINDAFTGAPLNPLLGLYQCSVCKVFYHKESYDLLVEVNSSRCVSCSNASIRSLSETEARQSERRNYHPSVVTLENVRQCVGRVITFEGYVHDVMVSRRGSDYAVMFENTTWVKGFKLVFFRTAARRIGSAYIRGLKRRTITVRGLVIKHPRFGYEIIISEKSMILQD